MVQAQLLQGIHDPWSYLTFVHSDFARSLCEFIEPDGAPLRPFFSIESLAFSLLSQLGEPGLQMGIHHLLNQGPNNQIILV